MTDRPTDEELHEILGLEDDENLLSSVAGKGGKLFIQVCAGQWIKYETETTWTWQPDPEFDE